MIKSSVLYLLTSIINKGIPFLLIPVLTHYLSPGDYGYVALFQLIIAFMHPLQNLNGNLYISKEFYVSSAENIKLVNGAFISIVSIFTLALLLIMVVLKFFFLDVFVLPIQWWVIALLCGILNSAYLNYLTLLRCREMLYKYAFLEISKSIFDVLATILLLTVLKIGWEGRAWGISSSIIVSGVYIVYILWKTDSLHLVFNKPLWNRILAFSLPLIPYSFGSVIINFSDRIFIEHGLGKSELGIYAVAYSIGMSLLIFTESYNKAWAPLFFSKAKHYPENRTYIIRQILIYVVLVLIMPVVIHLLSKYFIFRYLINMKYHQSLQYILGISYAYAFQGIFLILYPYLAWLNKTKLIGLITLLAMCLNLILNFILIKEFKLWGAVYATQATYIFMTIAVLAYVIFLLRNGVEGNRKEILSNEVQD